MIYIYIPKYVSIFISFYIAFPDEMGFTLSTGLMSSPLSSSVVADVTSGSILGGIKYYRFYGWGDDHDHAAAILAAASKPKKIKFMIEIVPELVNDLTECDINKLVAEWSDMVKHIYCIALGNEPLLNGLIISQLPEKLQLVYDTLESYSEWRDIPVSIPFSAAIFGTTYPVVDSTFNPDYQEYMASIIEIYQNNSAPFSVQIYPFFVCLDQFISLDYCLGEESAAGEYSSMLAAQYEATYYAMEHLVSNHSVEIIITETGWPTYSGDSMYSHATTKNAIKYYKNTIRLMNDEDSELYDTRIYFFEVFDEDLKDGDHEQNFGFFDATTNLKIEDIEECDKKDGKSKKI